MTGREGALREALREVVDHECWDGDTFIARPFTHLSDLVSSVEKHPISGAHQVDLTVIDSLGATSGTGGTHGDRETAVGASVSETPRPSHPTASTTGESASFGDERATTLGTSSLRSHAISVTHSSSAALASPTPEPGGTPGTPMTALDEAWEDLRRDITDPASYEAGRVAYHRPLIEAEAARSERERLRAMFDEEGCQAVYGALIDPDRRS